MRNWLGQDIEVGSVVGRGTRQSSTSVFQVGLVTEIVPPKLKARVEWKYSSRNIMEQKQGGTYANGTQWFNNRTIGYAPSKGWDTTSGKGSLCSIESLFVLPEDTLDRAQLLLELGTEYYSRQGTPNEMTEQEWLDRFDRI